MLCRFFPTIRFLKLKHTPPPPECAVHQVTLGSCNRCLFDSLQSTICGEHEGFVPIVCSSIQSSLPLIFSASSNHGTPDRFRPCCHMRHSSIISPFICHCLSACCPLSYSDGSCRALSACVSAFSLRGSPRCALILTMKVHAPCSTLAFTRSTIDVTMSAFASPASVVLGPLPIHLDTLLRAALAVAQIEQVCLQGDGL